MADSVLILGARGSLPVSGRQFIKYGGATSSYLVTLCGQTVVLDGGTGLLNLPSTVLAAPELDLILSHPHADRRKRAPSQGNSHQEGDRQRIIRRGISWRP